MRKFDHYKLTLDEVIPVSDAGEDVSHTVDEVMERFQKYDWLATVEKTEDGGWMMLFAPSTDPSEDVFESFRDDMDVLMESSNLDHVTEIGNGWVVSKDD